MRTLHGALSCYLLSTAQLLNSTLEPHTLDGSIHRRGWSQLWLQDQVYTDFKLYDYSLVWYIS